MTPSVSIVIPIYNREKTIARAIAGCLAQTYDRFELVLVDDCSTDDLQAALRAFEGDERVRLIRQPTNQGVSAARNRGVQEARGDWVAFLDSDDAWHPTKLDRQMTALAGRSPDENVLCATLTEVISDRAPTSITPTRRKPQDLRFGDYMFVRRIRKSLPLVDDPRAVTKDGYFIHVSSMMLPRRLALATPFRTTLNQYEDLAFLLDLERQGTEVVLIEEALTTQHDDWRPGRLGNQDDIERGHRFMEAAADGLSDDARLAFESSHLAHLYTRDRPLHAFRLTLGAFARGLIGPRSVAGIAFRSLFGQGRHRVVRDGLNSLRFGRN